MTPNSWVKQFFFFGRTIPANKRCGCETETGEHKGTPSNELRWQRLQVHICSQLVAPQKRDLTNYGNGKSKYTNAFEVTRQIWAHIWTVNSNRINASVSNWAASRIAAGRRRRMRNRKTGSDRRTSTKAVAVVPLFFKRNATIFGFCQCQRSHSHTCVTRVT